MWYVPIQHNTEQCGKMFVVWPVIEILISLLIIHYVGAVRVCHFQHVVPLKHNHMIRSLDHSFLCSVQSTPAVDASL
jgi:hypothetical protein